MFSSKDGEIGANQPTLIAPPAICSGASPIRHWRPIANAMAGAVPCPSLHEPQLWQAADDGPVVRLAKGPEREPDAEATGGPAARRGVEQRHVFLLHARGRRNLPGHALRGGDPTAGLACRVDVPWPEVH